MPPKPQIGTRLQAIQVEGIPGKPATSGPTIGRTPSYFKLARWRKGPSFPERRQSHWIPTATWCTCDGGRLTHGRNEFLASSMPSSRAMGRIGLFPCWTRGASARKCWFLHLLPCNWGWVLRIKRPLTSTTCQQEPPIFSEPSKVNFENCPGWTSWRRSTTPWWTRSRLDLAFPLLSLGFRVRLTAAISLHGVDSVSGFIDPSHLH